MSDVSSVVDAQGRTVNGILGLILESVGLGVNVEQQEKNRELQLQLVREQNQAAAQEAEKAYHRSKATTQVNNMRAAGMSQAGAVNVLNGGGSYTPAPVNVADVEPTQVDTSGIVSALQNIGQLQLAERQLQEQKRQFNSQLSVTKEMQLAQMESNERIAQLQADTTNRNADNRLGFDKEQFEFNKPKILAEISQIKHNSGVLKEVAKGHNLDNIRKDFENKRLPTLAKLADISAWQNIEYVAMKLAHENVEHMNRQERESLELEFLRATIDSGVSLQNIQNELQTYLSTQELDVYKNPIAGNFIGALVFSMEKLVPKFALLK